MNFIAKSPRFPNNVTIISRKQIAKQMKTVILKLKPHPPDNINWLRFMQGFQAAFHTFLPLLPCP